MKYWEIIADNLIKAGGSWVVSERLIPMDEQSGLRTRIAVMESVSLCRRMKTRLRFWNSKRGFSLLAKSAQSAV